MLEVMGLHAGYGSISVLRGLDLKIREGEFVAVLGPAGSGRSTLAFVLAGLVHPRAGTVRFDGRDLSRAPARSAVDAGLIVVPQRGAVLADLTVRENLVIGCIRRARASRSAGFDAVLGLFPRLRDRWRRRAGGLTAIEQRMLAVGRGLMARPRLLVLDEPSHGLTSREAGEMIDLVDRIHGDGMTTLLGERDDTGRLLAGGRIHHLHRGRLVPPAPRSDTLGLPGAADPSSDPTHPGR